MARGYTDRASRPLAKVHFEGKVSGGAFGGDFDTAIDAVAGEVAKYTKANFAPPVQSAAKTAMPARAAG